MGIDWTKGANPYCINFLVLPFEERDRFTDRFHRRSRWKTDLIHDLTRTISNGTNELCAPCFNTAVHRHIPSHLILNWTNT